MEHTSSYLLARHCGAVLLGKKPAGLFPLGGGTAELTAVAGLAAANGLCTLALRKTPQGHLVFVYNPALLGAALGGRVPARMLAQLGYPTAAGLEGLLAHLKARFSGEDGFPHEVGFFLGYPPADVVGFILFGGRRCKHSCMWKVYGDVAKAKSLCAEFEQCTQACCRHLQNSGRLPAANICVLSAV